MIKFFNNLRPFFVVITILVFVGPIIAQNTITAENNNGLYNENLTLSFSLDNTDEIAALQFDVVYDPLAFAISGLAQLDPAIVNHSIGSSQPESGRLRIVIFSLSGDVISVGNQSLLTVPITTKYEPGDFTLTIENIVASDAIGAALTATGSNGNLLVEGPKYVLVSQNIDFGEVPMLSAPTQSMTIQNQGNTELILNSYTVNTPPFLTDTFPVSIPAFGSTQLTVGLETTAKQLVNEQLSISTNDPSALRATQRSTILADIFAVNEIYIGSGSGPINTNVSIPVSVENMEPFNGFQFDITLPQDITYVPGSVALSGREVDHSVAASMINSNTLRILGYSLNNEDFTGTTGELLTFELLPAVSSGTYPLNIQNPILTHVDFGNIISEAYNGQISINAPNLSLSTSSIDFGRVPINDTGEEIVTLTNNGSLALEIDEVVYNDPTLTSTITTPLVLDISESSQETITFTPAQTGLFSSSISIRHNGSAGQNVISIAADVFSPNYLLIEERFAYPGTSAQVSLQGSFYEDIRGIQFDINVPTDFTLDLASVTEEMALSNFQVSSAALGNGDYRFIIYTLSTDLISSGTVPLLQLPIAVSPDAFGDYPMAISNVVLSNIDNQNIASEALLEGVVHVVENLPPTASDQTISTAEDTPAEITLVGADTYNDPLTYSIVDQPTNGTAVLTGNTVDYTPDGDYNGPDSFTFKVNDGTTDSNTATVSINVTPVNDAPVASDQSVTTDEDTMIQITLVATDVDGDPLTYSIVDQPTNGTAVLTGNTVDYTPDGNYNGPDSFTFKVNDGTTDSNTATVSIDVTPVNDAPVASDQSVTTDEDTMIQITLVATDVDGDPLTYSIVDQPTNGTAVLTGNTVDYTPDGNYNGPDSFTFKVNDGTTDSNTATVSIDVTPVNDAPVASDQSVTTDEDTLIQITLVATDVDGDPLTYSIVDQPTNGTAVLTGNTVDYTPDADYNGPDSFTFKVNDGTTDSNTATVSIDVTPVNDAPVASDQSVTTDEDTLIQITLVATDVDGDPLTYSIVDQPTNGTAVLTGNTVDYTPDGNYNGPDSFTFTVNDGTTDSNTATVSIDVTPVNDAPVASDQSVTTDEDTMIQITLVATDVDGDPLTYSIVDQPTNGTAVLTGNTVDYTPDGNYNGPDSFTFKVNDGTTDSNTATVSIDVTPVNDAPVASDQSVTTDEDTLIQITLSATDIEGDPLTYSIVDEPTNGTAVLTGNTVDYTPDGDYNGPDSFTFTVNDGTTDSNTATVSIDVTPVNDAPVASDQSVTTDEDTLIQITLSATDIEGDPLTYSIVDQPTNGTAVLTGNTVDYTPDADYNGPDSFTFKVNDGTTDSNTATVSIDVTPVNDAPVASDQSVTTDEDTLIQITLVATDVDGDPLTYSIVDQPTNGTAVLTGNTVDYTPDGNYNGPDSFTFKVNDGTTDSNTATVSIDVLLGLNEYGIPPKISPNPFNNRVFIELEFDANGRLFDISGKLVKSFKLNAGSNTVFLDNLSNGIYFMRLDNDYRVFVTRLIKE